MHGSTAGSWGTVVSGHLLGWLLGGRLADVSHLHVNLLKKQSIRAIRICLQQLKPVCCCRTAQIILAGPCLRLSLKFSTLPKVSPPSREKPAGTPLTFA